MQMEKAEKVRHGIRIRAAGGRLLWWVALSSLIGGVIFLITFPHQKAETAGGGTETGWGTAKTDMQDL